MVTRQHRAGNRLAVAVVGAGAVTAALLTATTSPAAGAAPTLTTTPYGNLAEALQKSVYFYDAEESGPSRSMGQQPLEWRGDSEPTDARIPLESGGSGTTDLALTGTNLPAALISQYREVLDPDGDGFLDLSQGFHDAGDHVKFGLPQSYTASTLAWGVYEFKDAYVRTGSYNHVMEELRWFSDYLLRSTFRDASGKVIAFNYMVGRGGVDHTYWGPPELQDGAKYPRPATFAYPAGSGWSAAPAADQAAEAAAALALMSLVTRDDDATYAARCLDVAEALYAFAAANRGMGNGDGFYPSSSDADDLSWAAVWLYVATGTEDFVDDIIAKGSDGNYTGYLKAIISGPGSTWQNIWVHSWDSVWGGVFAKLAPAAADVIPASDLETYWYFFRWNAEYWTAGAVRHADPNDGNYLKASPAGYSVISTWGSARYNTAAQLQALVYRKYCADDPGGSTEKGVQLSQWALSQMNYIMGDNPLSRSYIVGFTANSADHYASHPHHRAAHGSSTNSMLDPVDHRHTLWGALVGGPDTTDQHEDVTTDYVYNEVAIDYNAGFVGALAGLYTYFGSGQTVTPWTPPAEPAETAYYAKAKLEQDSDQRTQVTVEVNNRATHPPALVDDLSLRYYFDISELVARGQSISAVSTAIYYDESGTLNGSPAKITGPTQASGNVYYVEISWAGIAFWGKRELQFGLIAGQDSSWQSNWDSSNDPSLVGVSGAALAESVNIPVYRDGVRVFGEEPGGTPTTTRTTTTRPTTTTTTTSTTTRPTTTTTTRPTTTTTQPTTTTTQPTATRTTTTTTSGSGRSCAATYTVAGQWPSGFQADVTVRNTGDVVLDGWTVEWTFANGQTINQLWSGTLTTSGASVRVANAAWNGSLAPSGSTTFGFTGTWSGGNTAPTVTCTAG